MKSVAYASSFNFSLKKHIDYQAFHPESVMLSEADRKVMEAAAMLLAAFFHTMGSPSQRVRRLTCAADARLAPDIVGALHARMFWGYPERLRGGRNAFSATAIATRWIVIAAMGVRRTTTPARYGTACSALRYL